MRFFEKLKAGDFFLLDFIGACIAAIMLGIVIPKINELIGMPVHLLYCLAFFACGFALYSIYCYLFKPKNWRAYLKIIAYANLLYCGITLSLSVLHFELLTQLGIFYFIMDIGFVSFIAIQELKAANNPDKI